MEQTLWCQSCSMPLTSTHLWGTEASGKQTSEYCIYCYQDGAFTEPELTMQEMLESCVPHMVKDGMEGKRAREILQGSLPYLKRWSSNDDQASPAPVPQIVHLDAFTLAGIAARTSNLAEQTAQAAIPHLWARYHQEQISRQLADSTESTVVYGCYTDYESDISGAYTLLVGQRVDVDAGVTVGLENVHVPSSAYAVFTTAKGPLTQVVIEAWQAIWRWQTGTQFKRTYTGDFERYDERSSDPGNAQVDIYIAIAP